MAIVFYCCDCLLIRSMPDRFRCQSMLNDFSSKTTSRATISCDPSLYHPYYPNLVLLPCHGLPNLLPGSLYFRRDDSLLEMRLLHHAFSGHGQTPRVIFKRPKSSESRCVNFQSTTIIFGSLSYVFRIHSCKFIGPRTLK
jgi:hypothetical protein